MDDMNTQFDWSPLGRDWWIDTARQTGGSERQAMFACCKFRNCSNTESARQAGYSANTEAGLRTAGYRVARENAILRLLALASAEQGGGPDGTVDAAEVRRIISQLARGSDPAIRIRACEAIAKLDQADRAERVARRELSADDVALEIMRCAPAYAPVILGDSFFSTMRTIWGLPYLKELAPLLKRDFPKAWETYRASVKQPEHVLEFDALGDGPPLSIDEILARADSDETREGNMQPPASNGQDASAAE
jgi:hypothetical protein